MGGDFATTSSDSTNAVVGDATIDSVSSGASVVGGVTTDGPGDDTVEGDFTTTDSDSTSAVVGDSIKSPSSGASVVGGVTTDGLRDYNVGSDFGTNGPDSTKAVIGSTTEIVSSGTIGGVGGAANCVPGDDNSVGGGAINSVCEGTNGTHEVFTNGICDDCDCANDSRFIYDNICNPITDTNNDGRGATNLDGCVGGDRGEMGTSATDSASTSAEPDYKKVAVVKPFPRTYQVCSNV